MSGHRVNHQPYGLPAHLSRWHPKYYQQVPFFVPPKHVSKLISVPCPCLMVPWGPSVPPVVIDIGLLQAPLGLRNFSLAGRGVNHSYLQP